MIICTCGTEKVPPGIPKAQHPIYCDINKKYVQKWNDFQQYLMYDYSGGRYLYVTDDRERLSVSPIFADILSGTDALEAISKYSYQEIWIEDESSLAYEIFNKAINNNNKFAIVKLLRDF